MSSFEGLELGAGWAEARGVPANESLMIRQPFPGDSWARLDPSTFALRPLRGFQGWPRGGSRSRAWYCPNSNRIIIAASDGILAYDIGADREDRILQLEDNCDTVDGIWCRPGSDFPLIFSVSQSAGKMALAYEAGGEERKKIPPADPTQEFFLLEQETSSPRSIAKFELRQSCADVHRKRNELVVESRGGISGINFKTGAKRLIANRIPSIIFCISPSGSLVVWDFFPQRSWFPWANRDPRIEEIYESGETRRITDGWYPGFSCVGESFAFLRGRKELWLHHANLDSLIVELAGPGSAQFLGHRPCWCLCGDHFAIPATVENDEIIWFIIDISRKTLFAFPAVSQALCAWASNHAAIPG